MPLRIALPGIKPIPDQEIPAIQHPHPLDRSRGSLTVDSSDNSPLSLVKLDLSRFCGHWQGPSRIRVKKPYAETEPRKF